MRAFCIVEIDVFLSTQGEGKGVSEREEGVSEREEGVWEREEGMSGGGEMGKGGGGVAGVHICYTLQAWAEGVGGGVGGGGGVGWGVGEGGGEGRGGEEGERHGGLCRALGEGVRAGDPGGMPRVFTWRGSGGWGGVATTGLAGGAWRGERRRGRVENVH